VLLAPLLACGGPAAVSPSDASAVGGEGTALTFSLQHACGADPIRVRFFDKEHNVTWPSATSHATLAVGATESYSLRCQTGARVCFGADEPAAKRYWGVTLANDRECAACCAICKDERLPTVRLDCP
jgi:hypothetical protein